jgi:hypothetical protein
MRDLRTIKAQEEKQALTALLKGRISAAQAERALIDLGNDPIKARDKVQSYC